uniref:Uncharacterized protein n=1 Tax=viral metagenome TaxID=1070528 RepID=A0A6H1ZAH6_9ZZZZ
MIVKVTWTCPECDTTTSQEVDLNNVKKKKLGCPKCKASYDPFMVYWETHIPKEVDPRCTT